VARDAVASHCLQDVEHVLALAACPSSRRDGRGAGVPRKTAWLRRATPGNSPYRVVDRDNQGYYLAGDGKGGTVYQADYGLRRGLAAMPDYAVLEAARGPLRLVLAADATDVAELERLLAVGGRKAVTSLAAALETVFHEVREAAGGLNASAASYAFAKRKPTTGRGRRLACYRRPMAPVASLRRPWLHRLLKAPVLEVGTLRSLLRAHPAIEVAQRRIGPEVL
jgi:hypothetical protein